VNASAVGRPVEIHACADRIIIRQDGHIVGEYRRSFGPGETIYDPWHYVPVLAASPAPAQRGTIPGLGIARRVGTRAASTRPF
jgi:hypothetical protein